MTTQRCTARHTISGFTVRWNCRTRHTISWFTVNDNAECGWACHCVITVSRSYRDLKHLVALANVIPHNGDWLALINTNRRGGGNSQLLIVQCHKVIWTCINIKRAKPKRASHWSSDAEVCSLLSGIFDSYQIVLCKKVVWQKKEFTHDCWELQVTRMNTWHSPHFSFPPINHFYSVIINPCLYQSI